MKKLALVLMLVLLTACGGGTAYILKGSPGPKGDTGAQGASGGNGHNSLIAMVNVAPTCANGGVIVLSGLDLNDDGILESSESIASQAVCNGLNGSTGATGANGHNAGAVLLDQASGGGASCSNGGVTILVGTDLNDNGQLEPTEVTQSKDVCNGSNGINGTNAPSLAFTPVGLVDPCGTNPSLFNEVFIRLQNGMLVASFSDNEAGKNIRLSVLKPGNFQTTDGDNCTFSVSSSNQITNENHRF